MSDKFLAELNNRTEKASKSVGKVKDVTFGYLKQRWIDITLIFIICFVLGAFDIFILKRSDKIGQLAYWSKAGCRFIAYVCASIVGVRMGLPQARSQMKELQEMLAKNSELLAKVNTTRFPIFLEDVINKESKINAWKWKIKKQLRWLDRFTKHSYRLYYIDHNTAYFGNIKGKKLEKEIEKAKKYELKRKNLEMLLEEKYILDNLDSLNVKYYRVSDKDFESAISSNTYDHYTTRSTTAQKSTGLVGRKMGLVICITLVMGLLALEFDEELFERRVVGIITCLINCLLDVGLTLWKFISSYMGSYKIIKESEFQAECDKHKILNRYYEWVEKSSATENSSQSA